MQQRPIDIERLLGHAGWVRGLAGRLVADPARAEDLAQETLLVALERPPRHGPGLKPWLGAVARKLALRRQRDRTRLEQRHRDVAQDATRDHGEASAADAAADVELRALVGSAVAELAEPYRTTVMLRYFGGLSSAEIARREGVPESTVRSRLKRALERLRSDLDARHGGREVWCSAVVGLLAPRATPGPGAPDATGATGPSGATGAAATEGILVMEILTMKAILGSVAVVLVLAAGWMGIQQLGDRSRVDGGERLEQALPAAAVADAPAPAALVEPAAAATESTRSAATAVAVEPEADVAVEPPAATAELMASVEARLTDQHGVGLPGGSMTLESESVRAGSDGRARLEHELVGQEAPVEVRFEHPGLATRFVRVRLRAGETAYLGEVRLGPAGVITGRVEDDRGHSFPGARVFVTAVDDLQADPDELRRNGPELDLSVVEAEAGRDGGFVLEGVATGFVRVWANAEGCGYSSEGPFEVLTDETLNDVRIVLAQLRDDDRIAGVVLSPDGEPVASAHVSYSFRFGNSSTVAGVMTDEEGAFSLTLAHRVPHHFRANDPGERWSVVSAPDVEPGTSDLVLRFQESREIEVVALDGAGEAVEEFEVRLEPSLKQNGGGIYRGALARVPRAAHSGGRVPVRVPAEAFQLVVDAEGYELAELGPYEPEEVPDVVEVLVIELPGIHGQVLAAGRPVAGVSVGLRQLVDPDTLYVQNGFRCIVEPYDLLATTSDAEGRFHLYPRTAGEYVMRAEQEGFATAELGPLDVDVSRALEDLELVLGPGGAIEGCLVVPPGVDPAGLVIGLNHGDGAARTVRADPEGCYRFEGLTPGLWELTGREAELSPSQSVSSVGPNDGGEPFHWSCEVLEGETTWFDLDLRQVEPVVLRGVLALGSADPTGWTASVRKNEWFTEEALGSALTDAGGHFELEVPRPGAYELLLRAPGGLELEFDVELAGDASDWAETLALASLQGTGALGDLQQDQTLGYVAESTTAAGTAFKARAVVRADAQGRFQLPLVLAGKGKVGHYANRPGGGWRWMELGAFDAAEGELAQVAIAP